MDELQRKTAREFLEQKSDNPIVQTFKDLVLKISELEGRIEKLEEINE